MNARTLIVFGLGIPFFLLTQWALYMDGFVAIFEVAFANPASAQVFADLSISLLLVLTFVAEDCKRRGATFWPWIPATFALGSLAPLAYFGWRAVADRRQQDAPSLSAG